MPAIKQAISSEIRNSVRRDFILGKGSISSLARNYKVTRQTISSWMNSEKWEDMQSIFASEDELFVLKSQLTSLNSLIRDENDSESLLQLFKCKQAAFEMFARIAGLPRAPIGKLEKPKNTQLIDRLEAAARAQTEQEGPIEPVIDVSSDASNVRSMNDLTELNPNQDEKPL